MESNWRGSPCRVSELCTSKKCFLFEVEFVLCVVLVLTRCVQCRRASVCIFTNAARSVLERIYVTNADFTDDTQQTPLSHTRYTLQSVARRAGTRPYVILSHCSSDTYETTNT